MTLDELVSRVRTDRPDGTALDHLTEAAAVAARLDELADRLVGHFVDQARRSGASWTDIGKSMGVTRQAAQKRFVPKESADVRPGRARTPGLVHEVPDQVVGELVETGRHRGRLGHVVQGGPVRPVGPDPGDELVQRHPSILG